MESYRSPLPATQWLDTNGRFGHRSALPTPSSCGTYWFLGLLDKMNVWVGRITHSIICVSIQTYIPNVAPVCLCSFLFASLSGSVFNVSISCNPQYKRRRFVTIPLERLLCVPTSTRQLTRSPPLVARAAPSSSAVHLSGTRWSSWFRMGPTSNLERRQVYQFVCTKQGKTGRLFRGFPSAYLWGRICIMVTPVTVSPCMMVWKMGAGPRHLGSRLGWTFSIPLHRHTYCS